jgi:methyltransferase (TIGR00027 family)
VAGANALFRMAESRLPSGDRILGDPYGAALGESHALVALVRRARFFLPPLERMIAELQTAHCVRHRSIDELCLRAIAEGHRQLVIVGAGYDMRAARFAGALEGTRVFEVDDPETSARKQSLLAGLALPGPAVSRLPLELEQTPMSPALIAAGFDSNAGACFVFEGLLHYLRAATFERLLREVAQGRAPRRVLLSFIRPEMARRPPAVFAALVALLREIPRQPYTEPSLRELSARCGVTHFKTWRFAEQVAAFAPQARGRAVRVSQDVAELGR